MRLGLNLKLRPITIGCPHFALVPFHFTLDSVIVVNLLSPFVDILIVLWTYCPVKYLSVLFRFLIVNGKSFSVG